MAKIDKFVKFVNHPLGGSPREEACHEDGAARRRPRSEFIHELKTPTQIGFNARQILNITLGRLPWTPVS